MSLKNLAAILDPQAPADRPFIIQVSPEGDEQLRLSYGEARARIAALARGLLKRGLKRGEAVAIVAANSTDYLVLYMATMAAGLVSVCVNHKLPRETVAHIMKDSVVKLAIADAERAPLVSALVPTVAIEQLDGLLDPGSFDAVDMAPEEVAMILYTSGSTGLPKGVPLTHGGYIWATGATPEQRPGIEGQKVIIAAPLFHMNGLFSAKMVMINGGTIVLMTSFTARGYIRAIDRQSGRHGDVGADHAGAGDARDRGTGQGRPRLRDHRRHGLGAIDRRSSSSRCTGCFPTPRRPIAGARPSPARWASARIPTASPSRWDRSAIRARASR